MVAHDPRCVRVGSSALKLLNDAADSAWYTDTFIPTVQTRGAAIIAARGASSAASAGSSAIDNMRDWILGGNGEWTSMAVWTEGQYGVADGIYSSFPVTTHGAYDGVGRRRVTVRVAE